MGRRALSGTVDLRLKNFELIQAPAVTSGANLTEIHRFEFA
jgi:hypothetical protein